MKQAIKRLREIEAMASVLMEEAAKVRVELEKGDKPVPVKVLERQKKVEHMIARRKAQFKPA